MTRVTYIVNGKRVDPFGNVVENPKPEQSAKAGTPPADPVDLATADPDALNAPELKKLAAMLDIEGRSKMNVDELRAAIKAAREESGDESGGADDQPENPDGAPANPENAG